MGKVNLKAENDLIIFGFFMIYGIAETVTDGYAPALFYDDIKKMLKMDELQSGSGKSGCDMYLNTLTVTFATTMQQIAIFSVF